MHQAYLSADAISRTLLRLFVTQRRMLEWETAASAAARAAGVNGGRGLLQFAADMMASPIIAGVVATMLAMLIAVPLGLIAGYYRGWWDPVISRISSPIHVTPVGLQGLLFSTNPGPIFL